MKYENTFQLQQQRLIERLFLFISAMYFNEKNQRSTIYNSLEWLWYFSRSRKRLNGVAEHYNLYKPISSVSYKKIVGARLAQRSRFSLINSHFSRREKYSCPCISVNAGTINAERKKNGQRSDTAGCPSHHVIPRRNFRPTCTGLRPIWDAVKVRVWYRHAQHPPWRKSSLNKTSARRNLKCWSRSNLRDRLAASAHPHGVSINSRRFRVCAASGSRVTRNERHGSCRTDFPATRVYISDRVSDITPYVSYVIWC